MKFRILLAILLCGFCAQADLLVSGFNSGRVYRFNEHSGQFVDVFVPNTNNLLNLPHELAFGPDGNLYVASFGGQRVVRFNGTSGALIGDFAVAGTTGLSGPNFMLFHDFGPPRIDSVVRAQSNVIVSWPGRADTQLQSATNLTSAEWQTLPGTQGRNSATNNPSSDPSFYRLIRD